MLPQLRRNDFMMRTERGRIKRKVNYYSQVLSALKINFIGSVSVGVKNFTIVSATLISLDISGLNCSYYKLFYHTCMYVCVLCW